MNRTITLVVGSLLIGVAIDLVTDSYYPTGVMPAFVLTATLVLILGAKWFGARVVQRPVDSRPGDVDPHLEMPQENPVDGSTGDRAGEAEGA